MAGLGWTFRVPGQHLYIIVSDPALHPRNQFLCVNVTDAANYHGDAFFLQPGDHPAIYKRSVLYFPEAFASNPQILASRITSGQVERCADLDQRVLRRVIDACRKTRHLPKELRYFLHLA